MTIINRSYNFVFVHVPKTAGTSVTNTLSKYTGILDLEIGGTRWGEQIQRPYRQRFGVGKHATASEVRRAIGSKAWDASFTFGFCRHPLMRCYSTFNFLRKWESPNKSFNKSIRKFKRFEDFVLSDMLETTSGPDRIFCPQATWLLSDDSNNVLAVDYVGRLETIDKDMKVIFEKLCLPVHDSSSSQMPILNRSMRMSRTEKWSLEVVEKVKQKYEIDFRLFGYD